MDLDSDLLTSVDASSATTADAAVLEDLLENDPEPVQEVLADTAYGSRAVRARMLERGIELLAPLTQPRTATVSRARTDAFDIDLEKGSVTCPAGNTATHRRHEVRRSPRAPLLFQFAAEVCAACPLRSACTTSTKGRIVSVGPQEALLGFLTNP